MGEKDIVHIALENLQKTAGIIGTWQANGVLELDGKLEITLNNQLVTLNVEVKQELRNHQLPKIIDQGKRLRPLIVIANHILPKIKEELRQKQIAYLEANGNFYLQQHGIFLWIDTQKPNKAEKDKGNRAFTKTGLKVVFYFLLNENFINLPYREIAGQTEVALGNINYVMNGLKEVGFLIKLNETQYKLHNKKELLNKWMIAYEERLRPAIKVGTFRFLKEEDFNNWQNLKLIQDKTRWGGEPAGDLYTNYLRPAELTLYTKETRNDLIKNYRLIPDEKGNVKVYKKFWTYDEVTDNVVPPLLAYVDLMNTNDRRCIETAQKIYDERLQNNL